MQIEHADGPSAIVLPYARTPDISTSLSTTAIAPYTNGISLTSLLDSQPNPTVKSKDRGKVKPKQKRSKPTLSCLECVERKTKCDRGRPCLACVKRQSNCEYTPVANLIALGDRKNDANS